MCKIIFQTGRLCVIIISGKYSLYIFWVYNASGGIRLNAFDRYQSWLNDVYFDEDTKRELLEIRDNPREIEERFYKDLEFGTGGLRGIIGAGTNRMNIYTVRKASQGVARCILKGYFDGGRADSARVERGVVIAYDSRHKSDVFALEAAKVFAANGIKAWLFDDIRPTPELSFAVRYLNAAAGIVITASHNPKEYNGYKVYGSDGGQITLQTAEAVLAEINDVRDFADVRTMPENEAREKGLLVIIGEEIDDAYISELKKLSVYPEIVREAAKDLRIVYTPIHGTGNRLVRRILKEIGVENVTVVPEQELPDPDFSTVKSPNPEEREAFTLAIRLAEKENADLIIGTDPDCDRVGVVVRNASGEYVALTGNQTGCLLLEYILSGKKRQNTMPEKPFAVKTIVTTELARRIAARYNVELVDVLTGFKFIGEQIKLQDELGDKHFLFGFEESYGYLAGTAVRDKDGVVASMLIAEMAAWYKTRGMTLYDGLQELYRNYGYALEGLKSFTLVGKEGIAKIKKLMEVLREDRPASIGSFGVLAVRDYLKGVRYDLRDGHEEALDLPESDVLYFELEGDCWLCIRPSGTEPKLKIYYGVSGNSYETASTKYDEIEQAVAEKVENLLNMNGH